MLCLSYLGDITKVDLGGVLKKEHYFSYIIIHEKNLCILIMDK